LVVIEHELLLFAAFWFVISLIDEVAVDLYWLWLKLNGHAKTQVVPAGLTEAPLLGPAAIIVAAWQEHAVIGYMISHTLKSWCQRDFTLYIGCYPNDPATVEAALTAAGGDPRVRIVINSRNGPTTKADCLNRVYEALRTDEMRRTTPYRNIIMHDSEDMVHPAALAVMDRALAEVDFVQLPVRPEPQPDSHWIAGHYSDEFTENHAKTLVVRDALGAGIPAAGVGCGFSREAMAKLAILRMSVGEAGPFSPDCLTEDYELGLLISRCGGYSRYLRMRDSHGHLVATRSYFPSTLETSVRQKSRWIHGIAFQGWERMGWSGRPVENWMALRDRRGPMTAVVLAAGYLLITVAGMLGLARIAGWQSDLTVSPMLRLLLILSLIGLGWRVALRLAFTAREYGLVEGLRSILRIPIANIVAIMAGRRALFAYISTLRGAEVSWDKTEHKVHPTTLEPQSAAS
jgi:bacteriophage N4 adsorption protein B